MNENKNKKFIKIFFWFFSIKKKRWFKMRVKKKGGEVKICVVLQNEQQGFFSCIHT